MAQQLAARLAKDGHQVTMVVPFPNRPDGVLFPGFRRRLRSRTVAPEGYSVVRCANWLLGKRRRHIYRLLENITFGLSSAWAAWREGRPDVLILETWPMFATQMSALLADWWQIPYLYYVQDVYPEAAESLGILNPDGKVARLCRSWDRRLCSRSSATLVISKTMQNLLVRHRQLSSEHFVVIPNWIDGSTLKLLSGQSTWRREQGIPENAFVALFGGTLGEVSGVEVLIEVAQILHEEKDVLIVCVGEGTRKKSLEEAALRLRLKNFRLLPFQPQERVYEVQNAADVALLTIQPRYSNASVPSKLISYFAAARPVICAAATDSAVAQSVFEADAGVVVTPGDARAIAAGIVQIMRAPEAAVRMGANARRYFEEHYTLERAYSQFTHLLQRVVPADLG